VARRAIADQLKTIETLERRDTAQAERLARQHTLDLAAHVAHYCDFLG
jgi:hypothetical protein